MKFLGGARERAGVGGRDEHLELADGYVAH
jgi:hypothetical protein